MAFIPDTDQIIAALGQSNRISHISLGLAGWQVEQVLAAMQMTFPELTKLSLWSNDETVPVIPDSFLGGSATRLRYFGLEGIPFPGLPNLLLSATHLVDLWLDDIPHSGYILPEAIVALLFVLSSLKTLFLKFKYPQSRSDRETRYPPLSKRSVIPALTSLHFQGVTEYLEDLVAHIDAPQLDDFQIYLFNQIDFDIPRLAQFINRTPKLWKLNTLVEFDTFLARIKLTPKPDDNYNKLEIAIRCRESDWQLSAIEQVCNSSLHPLSTAEDLYINCPPWGPVWKDDAIESALWLQLLLPFTAVKNLYLSKNVPLDFEADLQELVVGRTIVLPSLQNIFVEPRKKPILYLKQFAAARQLSNHPIAISF